MRTAGQSSRDSDISEVNDFDAVDVFLLLDGWILVSHYSSAPRPSLHLHVAQVFIAVDLVLSSKVPR